MRIIETSKLYLREFNSEDISSLYYLNQDEEVIQYTGDRTYKNLKEVETFLTGYASTYKNYQMGQWAVCTVNKGEFIGWCGLQYHPASDLVEVDCRLLKKHWNKGYASLAFNTVIAYGFNSLRVQDIYAFINSNNKYALRIAEKAGLEWQKETTHKGLPVGVYKISNQFIQVKQIPAQETYSVRHTMLRQGRPLSDCVFEGDDATNTFHLGLYYSGILAGVASFMSNEDPALKARNPYQLRGMAILHQFQDKKLGNILLREAERILIKKESSLLWCNARERAVNFYRRNGFICTESPFDIPSIGLHYKMYKTLEKEIHRFY